jgi:hypothetical protein
MTVRILPFAVQTQFSRTMEPVKPRFSLGYLSMTTTAMLPGIAPHSCPPRSLNAHDLPRLDAHPLPRHHLADEQILRIEEFSQVAFCDIKSLSALYCLAVLSSVLHKPDVPSHDPGT